MTETIGFGLPPVSITWDGRNSSGQLPGVDTTFDYRLWVTSTQGLTAVTGLKPVRVDLAAPVTPTITSPTGSVTRTLALTSIAGTAGEAGARIVVWLQQGTERLWLGDTVVAPDLTWSVAQVPLNSGPNVLWATATDAADQESGPSNVVTITVEVQPPLKTLERSPFPAGLGQTLLFTATARGEDGSGLGRTTYVTATLATQEEDELLPFSSANPTAFTSTWTASRLVEPILGDAIYDVPVEGQDANGLRGTSHIGIWTDITPPGVPHLIDPSLPHPVNQSTYPVKGTADRGSLVVLLVGATTYTTTTGNELGVWEIPASLAAGPNSLRVKAA